MSKIREVMTRDGVVQTFLQIPDIHKVQFTVGGQPLTNSRNQEVGEMTSDTFAQYTGKDKESYRYDTFTLYFMDKNGKNLVIFPVNQGRKWFQEKKTGNFQVCSLELSCVLAFYI